MEKPTINYLDFEVDKLTRSIENVVTGDCFETKVSQLLKSDLRSVTKKNGWVFDWRYEMKQAEREVYKLTILNNHMVVQGLISLQINPDHIYMHLVESASFNKGKSKMYAGVPGNLVAFACRLAFQLGFDGNVAFVSKTQLINHYIDSLGATHFGGRLMIIEEKAAKRLVNRYYKDKID